MILNINHVTIFIVFELCYMRAQSQNKNQGTFVSKKARQALTTTEIKKLEGVFFDLNRKAKKCLQVDEKLLDIRFTV